MSPWQSKIALTLLSSLALTFTAAAQSEPSYQGMALGDVWIGSSDPTLLLHSTVANSASSRLEIPSGDVWVLPDTVTSTAEPSTTPQRNDANPDYVRTGSAK
jgi:hypothetical protein